MHCRNVLSSFRQFPRRFHDFSMTFSNDLNIQLIVFQLQCVWFEIISNSNQFLECCKTVSRLKFTLQCDLQIWKCGTALIFVGRVPIHPSFIIRLQYSHPFVYFLDPLPLGLYIYKFWQTWYVNIFLLRFPSLNWLRGGSLKHMCSMMKIEDVYESLSFVKFFPKMLIKFTKRINWR